MRTTLLIFVCTFAASAFVSVVAQELPRVSYNSADAATEKEADFFVPTASSSQLQVVNEVRVNADPIETEEAADVRRAAAAAPASAPQPARTVQTAVAPRAQPLPQAVDENKRTPVRVSVPSVGIDSPIVGVGINSAGEMAVPSGSTNNVGWYKHGTVPGDIGSAVFDAHVFAAFAPLDGVSVGDSIYVTTEGGQRLRFVVEQATVYKLGDLSPETLFNRRDARRLNLITCAGQLTVDKSTYTHRLVVYAVYAGLA